MQKLIAFYKSAVWLYSKLSGYKTYFSALGLVFLAMYNFSIGNIPGGFQALLNALAAVGVRSALGKLISATPAAQLQATGPMDPGFRSQMGGIRPTFPGQPGAYPEGTTSVSGDAKSMGQSAYKPQMPAYGEYGY